MFNGVATHYALFIESQDQMSQGYSAGSKGV